MTGPAPTRDFQSQQGRKWQPPGLSLGPVEKRALALAGGGAIGLVVVAFAAIVGFYAWGASLGGLDALRRTALADRSAILTWSDGQVFEHRRPRLGASIDVRGLPPHVTLAFLAAEDDDFYRHDGVTLPGIGRAALANLRAGDVREGASTITQQIVKNSILRDTSQTGARKVRELFIARNLEEDLKRLHPDKVSRKNALVGYYLASSDFGTGPGGEQIHGLALAAGIYFDKAPADLTMAEAAVLAAVLNATTDNNPCRRPDRNGRSGWDRAVERARGYILPRMGGIDPAVTPAVRAAAAEEISRLRPRCVVPEQSVRWALRHIEGFDAVRRPPLPGSGMPVAPVLKTTLDREAQSLAAEVVAEEMAAHPDLEVALVAVSGDGAVRALIGGRDFRTSNYNRAIPERGRQVGSVYKGFIFAAALEAGARPQDLCRGDGGVFSAMSGEPWAVADGRAAGASTLKQGYAASSNAVAVRLAYSLGYDRVVGAASRLGFASKPDRVSSWPLVGGGKPVHVAAAFAAFGNGGYAVKPHFLEGARRRGEPVLKPATLAGMAVLGQAVRQAGGTGTAGDVPGLSYGAKTGTTNGNVDAWFVAYGQDFALVVWVGADKPRRTTVSGSTLPARIAARFLSEQTLGWGRRTTWAGSPPAGEGRAVDFGGSRRNFCAID